MISLTEIEMKLLLLGWEKDKSSLYDYSKCIEYIKENKYIELQKETNNFILATLIKQYATINFCTYNELLSYITRDL